jgi:hypothetical protein
MTRTLLLLFLTAPTLSAQAPMSARPTDTPAPYAVWSTGGLSLMTLPYGLGSNASLSMQRGHRSFRLGFNGASNLKSTVTSRAVSLSVGAHRKTGALHLDAFAGPAFVWGDDGINDEGFAVGGEPYRTVGLITDVSVLVGLGSRVRLGVGTWANVNSQQSTVGAGPRLQLRLF